MTNEEFNTIDYKSIKINIACKGADILPLDAIEEFQGNLKKRSKKDIDKIIRSIVEYGFSFPFYVWNGTGHNYCLDGHGRILALAEMRKRGTDLPMFPVVYVDAENEEEAKQKLLRLNSSYGDITQSGFEEFTQGLKIEMEEINLNIPTHAMESTYEKKGEKFDFSQTKLPLVVAVTEDEYRRWEQFKSENSIKKDEECISFLLDNA